MLPLEVDATGQKLLSLLQREFPIVRRPYQRLAEKLGISEDEVISQVKTLKTKGFVRLIGPVMDARRLGYQSTLVAMRIAADRLETAERILAEHLGVSHGYEREHEFNVWFTLSLPRTISVADELRTLALDAGAEAVISLPARRLFKIGAYFDNESVTQPAVTGTRLPEEVELSPDDRKTINGLPLDLPTTAAPFDVFAEEAGMTVDELLRRCKSLVERGVIRRFSASVNHRRIGFKANAMTCWAVPPDIVDTAGKKLASRREVSHCYERETDPQWQYNLFAMMHSHSKEVCQRMATDISHQFGLRDYVLLFSTKEFKKTRVKYQV